MSFLPEFNAEGWRNLKFLLVAGFGVFASITLGLGNRHEYISAWVGGRYFWASSVLLAILFLSNDRWDRLQKVFFASLVAFSCAGTLRNFDGPDWSPIQKTNVAIGNQVSEVEVEIWPHGWTMSLASSCV